MAKNEGRRLGEYSDVDGEIHIMINLTWRNAVSIVKAEDDDEETECCGWEVQISGKFHANADGEAPNADIARARARTFISWAMSQYGF